MFLILLLIALVSIYFYLRNVYSYWEQKNFPSIPPSIPLGNLGSMLTKKRSFGLCLKDLYNQTTSPFMGIYLLYRPALLIRDADLVKNILTTDFEYFHDRGIYCDEKNDQFSGNLFALSSQRWKTVRAKFSPTFSSGKLKTMFSKIKDVGEELKNHLIPIADKEEVIEMKDLSLRYVLDIMGSVIFGIEVDTIKNPEHDFRAVGRNLTKVTLRSVIAGLGVFLCPNLLKILKLKPSLPESRQYMVQLVRDTIEYREKNNVSRNDFMQFLLQLRNPSLISKTVESNNVMSEDFTTMSVEQCAGHVFLFYIAGSESSSSSVTYCLFELTRKPDLMARVRSEIDAVIAKYNGQITYDSLTEMKFLDCCINEAIRKYPALPMLNRECTRDYAIPNTNYVIPKGTAIIMSLMGLQYDPKYFPNPTEFDPSRFSIENTGNNLNAFVPFGDGPRTCIAMRLAKIVVKMGLVILISNYNFESVNKEEIDFDMGNVNPIPKGGIKLKVSYRYPPSI